MPKALIIVALVLSVLAFLYSLMGIGMAYWVAAVPGNTPERIRLNFLASTFALALYLAWRLARRSSR